MQSSTDFLGWRPSLREPGGWADWAGGAAWPQAAGYVAWGRPGCRAEAGVQGAGRGWPLTLDLQDLVAEVGLEVEGAVGREHEPQAGRRGGGAQVTAGERWAVLVPPPHGLGGSGLPSPGHQVGESWPRVLAPPLAESSWRPQNDQPLPPATSPNTPTAQGPPPFGQQRGREGNTVRELGCCGSGVHSPQGSGHVKAS